MQLDPARYIPAGCISIPKDEIGAIEEFGLQQTSHQWWELLHEGVKPHQPGDNPNHSHLSVDVQKRLLNVPRLRYFAQLFRARWARLEIQLSTADTAVAVMRVFLLPDDAYRGVVDRSNPSLIRARQAALRRLNFSQESWTAQEPESPVDFISITELGRDDAAEDMSLLQVFNRIPPPEPDATSASDLHVQDAMFNLLESSVFGLRTNLYPYQRRSAALMLQKETVPERVLDPRLVTVRRDNNSLWYVDPVAGTILSEPRYYDGVCGGILAEEMGAGKTVICLALILASKDLPTKAPGSFEGGRPPVRRTIASLADMAASCATRRAAPWKPFFQASKDCEYSRCIEALRRNPGYYLRPALQERRSARLANEYLQVPKKIYLSSATVIVVPINLLVQWKQEIDKHTHGLKVLVITKKSLLPKLKKLLDYDIILFSQSEFENLVKTGEVGWGPLSSVHFKRCIVDEGHKLGNSRIGHKSNLLIGLDIMNFSSRWIVTGTPSHGLFGVAESGETTDHTSMDDEAPQSNGAENGSSTQMEKKDLQRLGSISSLYLKARPWANTFKEPEDTLADWDTYLLLPKHNPRSYGRWDSLKSTLNSLIIRHQIAEMNDMLPPVDEKIVMLDGSYQDKLSLNVFAMMIIFNSVQSQRTDMDYFFHPRQRKSLLQIVHNLKQTSFFGGSFFASDEIAKAVETAEGFLRDQKVPVSAEDEAMLREAIEFGHLAVKNKLRGLSNRFHEMPVCVRDFPARAGQAWSLDDENGDTVCTSSSLLHSLQKLLYHSIGEPEKFNALLNGGLVQEGILERDKILASQSSDAEPGGKDMKKRKKKESETLAGNTKLGDDSPRKSRPRGLDATKPKEDIDPDYMPPVLRSTSITSTVSAKLSYLIDSITVHQEREKMIIFYENENVAWYLAGMLDVLQIQHLIYAKGLTSDRRAQYVDTFNHNSKFRVLLMDLSQAAFGLDMREASRVYFINPVLNPQVEAQAIGRVRRISQQKPVSVETLVLKNSIDEVILERKRHMTQAEHRQVKSILDVQNIYDWIKNARVMGLTDTDGSNESQMTPLRSPQLVFGRGFGKSVHPDEGLVSSKTPIRSTYGQEAPKTGVTFAGTKRIHDVGPGGDVVVTVEEKQSLVSRPARRVKFAADSDE
ncbi:Annexin A7 [Purpureocillium lavendulum]|uniref:Annexin A7 n=1 Tax=Purpureocillium lavendulum TaxID=1247861 RepID=A0AB34G6U6_9HYPO|nr:Annexin A7 [Purpureocillium lavendulum]